VREGPPGKRKRRGRGALFHRVFKWTLPISRRQRGWGCVTVRWEKPPKFVATHRGDRTKSPHDRDANRSWSRYTTDWQVSGGSGRSGSDSRSRPRPAAVLPLLATLLPVGANQTRSTISPNFAGSDAATGEKRNGLDFVAVLLHNGYVEDASKLMQASGRQKPRCQLRERAGRVAGQGRKPEAAQCIGFRRYACSRKSCSSLLSILARLCRRGTAGKIPWSCEYVANAVQAGTTPPYDETCVVIDAKSGARARPVAFRRVYTS